jgi:hypothetical protein
LPGRRNEPDNHLVNTHHERKDERKGNFEGLHSRISETAKEQAEKKKKDHFHNTITNKDIKVLIYFNTTILIRAFF